LEEILSRGGSVALAPSFGLTKVVNRDNKEPSGHANKPHFENVATFLGAPIYEVADILRSHLDESRLYLSYS
jgi:hypothetical protein